MAIMSCVVSHRGDVLRLVASFPMQICSNDTSLPGGSSSQCLVKVHPAIIKIFSGRTGQKIYYNQIRGGPLAVVMSWGVLSAEIIKKGHFI